MLLSKGWRQIHGAHDSLVKDGVYAYARHPQYTGLFLVIIGFLVQWPTLLTIIMAPVLFYAYVRLAYEEENDMINRFGESYETYRSQLPAFFPPFDQWWTFLTAHSDLQNEQSI